ncbi:uncharacterized protein LOC116334093 [Oreochromis aureus]|uniref:uncharacterized protein LOC116334093 n=1 Tax=Oreochromis aureus TaxID=47969 RepID=UPI0012BC3E7B|nr:uncharacterized protein LOC116334093 [Oreochromis aureus]
MKLVFLVVVAVAVLPTFSESRIVSKCELRDKLGKMIRLSGRLGERVLATVICEVDRMSHLNTDLVKSFGKCIPATPKPTAPAATGPNEMTNGPVTPPNTNSTSTDLTNTTAPATPPTINSTIIAMNATFPSNSTGGVKRQRRHAHSGRHEKNKFSGEDRDDSEMEDENETSSEEDDESKNLYGLFQLSDREFCDSGLCPSKNMCHTSCKAFTDDDITDDIACVIQTGYWRDIMDRASESCRRTGNFFKECN